MTQMLKVMSGVASNHIEIGINGSSSAIVSFGYNATTSGIGQHIKQWIETGYFQWILESCNSEPISLKGHPTAVTLAAMVLRKSKARMFAVASCEGGQPIIVPDEVSGAQQCGALLNNDQCMPVYWQNPIACGFSTCNMLNAVDFEEGIMEIDMVEEMSHRIQQHNLAKDGHSPIKIWGATAPVMMVACATEKIFTAVAVAPTADDDFVVVASRDPRYVVGLPLA